MHTHVQTITHLCMHACMHTSFEHQFESRTKRRQKKKTIACQFNQIAPRSPTGKKIRCVVVEEAVGQPTSGRPQLSRPVEPGAMVANRLAHMRRWVWTDSDEKRKVRYEERSISCIGGIGVRCEERSISGIDGLGGQQEVKVFASG